MNAFVPALLLFGVALALAGAGYGLARLVTVDPRRARVEAFLSGQKATEHAFSRYHVRWYTLSMIFLAFEMEMLFMYPWTLVLARVGVSAVVEMFGFLAVLVAGVVYAWREGALRWA